MGWRLYFYRRVGEPVLDLSEVDAYFSARPGYHREPERDESPEGPDLTNFRFRDGQSGLALTFSFELWEPEEEEPGRADFPYEETPLALDMDYCQPDAALKVAVREVEGVAETLGLLVQDPQLGPEEPSRPNLATLERSYAHYSAEVSQTIAYLRQRRRNLFLIGAALLSAGLLLLLLSGLGVGH